MSKRVGLIGIGLMGLPMGLNWLSNKFQLTILPHKNKINSQELKNKGAHIAKDYKELVEQSDIICLMLPSSHEVELTVKSMLPYLTPAHIVIDMSTSDPKSTQKIDEQLRRKSLRYMDAPVTGGVKGAEAGSLTLFIGGEAGTYSEALPVLKAVSKVQNHFGSAGQGHVAKIINNFICIGNLAVLAEALPLGVKLGLNPKELFDTLLTGTASSEMLKIYGPQVLADDFKARFKHAHAFKDMRLAKSQSEDVSLPVLEGILKLFELSQQYGDENVSSIFKSVEAMLKAQFRTP